MRTKKLKADFRWEQWASTTEDYKQLKRLPAARILFDALAINEFEHALLSLKHDDAVWGPVHTSVGQEATAAATMAALRNSDKVASTYRSHHQFLSKALYYVLPDKWDPTTGKLPEAGGEVFRRTMAEIMGLAPGYCGGRGGSMHLRYKEAGFLGSNAIVAGGVPLAAGAAYAEKAAGTGNLVVCYIGDGAVNQGAFHEACNLAGLWKLPLVVFVENNLYAVATSVKDACAVPELSIRASSYAMDGFVVDGSDALGIYRLVQQVAESIRGGGPPALIEAKCYRRYHHAGDVPGSAYRYRTPEEESVAEKREVVRVLPKMLVQHGILSAEAVQTIRQCARDAVKDAVDYCTEPGQPRRIKQHLWPKPESAADGIRSSGAELSGATYRERDDFPALEEIRYSDAIAAVTGRWLERDANTIVFGEEVANLGGGAYGATKGLAERFEGRVINTPISEGGFSGLGFGAAMQGMRPVVEIMFADFALVAADQLFNQISKARHMYGDTTDLPLVVRSRVGTGLGYGAQHSMDPVGLYGLFPGFRIIAPADAFEYIGLFNTAMRSLDPVVILEHNVLYASRTLAPADDLDYSIPFGKARVVQEGKDVTVLVYSSMVNRCRTLTDRFTQAGISVELIDLRSLDHLAIDYETVGASVSKTGVVAVVEEAAASQGIGPTLATEIMTRFFDQLDGPVACISSLDISTPVSRVLEKAALLGDDRLVETVTAVARRQWK